MTSVIGTRITILGAFCLGFSLGFGQTRDYRVEGPENVPEWVTKLPNKEGFLFAVGVVGRTFYYEDGIVKAADAARKELAKNLAGRVQDLIVILQRTGRLHTAREFYVVQATTWATELVLENAEIVAFWVDRNGLVSWGEQGATYALGRLYVVGLKGEQ